MKTVYIVWASCGAHSDQNEWVVVAYPEKDVADLHAAKANEYVKTVAGGRPHLTNDEYDLLRKNPWDRECHGDIIYGGPDYVVVEVGLCLHPDEYLEKMTSP